MKAYYLVFVLTLLISLLYYVKTDKQWRWKLFWTFLPLFIFGAIRVNFGNDYNSYEEIFDGIHSLRQFQFNHEAHAEIGYQLLNWVMPSFRLLLVLNAFLLSLSFAVFSYHNIPKKYLWLAVVLLFLNPEKNIYGSLVGMRTGLCVSSFLLGFVWVQRRKWLPFFTLIAVMSTIHTSTLLFLPIAYFVGFNKPFKRSEIWIWLGAVVVLLLTSMTQIFDVISFLIDNDTLGRYEEVLTVATSHRGILQTLASLAFIIMFLVYFNQRGKTLSSDKNSLLRMGMFFSMTFFLGSLAMRASYFYDMFFIASVVRIFSDKKAKMELRWGILLLAIATSFYSMFYVWMGSPWWNHGIYHSLLGDW